MKNIFKNQFSYDEYKHIIKIFKKNLVLFSEFNANHIDSYVIIRHDVEFSVDRAYKLALLEEKLEIRTTYLFQINNNCYNVFSEKNIKLIREIHSMKHDIGLHVYLPYISNNNLPIKKTIEEQSFLMEDIVGIPVVAFSFHRPPKELLLKNIVVNGRINCYGSHFFTLFDDDNFGINKKEDVLYLSDSRHQWNFGYPDNDTFIKYNKIQILMHPYSWTETGGDSYRTFSSLIKEKTNELIESIDTECKHFAKIKHLL